MMVMTGFDFSTIQKPGGHKKTGMTKAFSFVPEVIKGQKYN